MKNNNKTFWQLSDIDKFYLLQTEEDYSEFPFYMSDIQQFKRRMKIYDFAAKIVGFGSELIMERYDKDAHIFCEKFLPKRYVNAFVTPRLLDFIKTDFFVDLIMCKTCEKFKTFMPLRDITLKKRYNKDSNVHCFSGRCGTHMVKANDNCREYFPNDFYKEKLYWYFYFDFFPVIENIYSHSNYMLELGEIDVLQFMNLEKRFWQLEEEMKEEESG